MAKKKKKRRQKVFPRSNEVISKKNIYVASDEPVLLHYNNGNAWLTGRNGRLLSAGPYDFTRTYRGEHRNHTVAAATNLPDSTTNVGSWVKNFDVVYAMDTNTKKCGDVFVSVGVVLRGEIVHETENSGRIIGSQWIVFQWYHDGSSNIELRTWVEALKTIGLYEPADAKVGVVIDSEYGKLADFNDRKIPLLGDYYLPENRWLIYASADRTDEWCNKMVSACDSIATEQLTKLTEHPAIIDPAEVSGGPVLQHTIVDKRLLPYIVIITKNE